MPIELNTFIELFLKGLALAGAAGLVRAIFGFVNLGIDALRAKLGTKQWAELLEIVDLAVKAAEQANLAGLIESKKDYAIEFAQKALDERGFSFVDVEFLVNTLIEAAVYEMNHQ